MQSKAELLIREHKRSVAKALRALQRQLLKFQQELATGIPRSNEMPIGPVTIYRPVEETFTNKHNNRLRQLIALRDPYGPDDGRRIAAEAIGELDYTEEKDGQTPRSYGSVHCYGSIGVPMRFVQAAIKVNQAKDAFRDALKPLTGRTVRRRITLEDGSHRLVPRQLISVMLSELQEARLNVLAAYRHIPVFTEQIDNITFQYVTSQSVESKTADELLAMLASNDSAAAERDRAALRGIPGDEKLSRRKGKYQRLQMRIAAARQYESAKSKRKRRVIEVKPAELPLLYPIHPSWPDPEINLPAFNRDDDKGRPPRLEDEPFVKTLKFHRKKEPYLSEERAKRDEAKQKSKRREVAKDLVDSE